MAHAEPRTVGVVDAQTALGFLAQASGVLARSLDYERTLAEIAGLAVPDLADWCAVDVLQPDGTLRQITSGHPNPDHEQLLLELRRRYRAEKGANEGVARVIATGEPELATDVTGEVALDLLESETRQYQALAPRSYMIVPLVARGRTLGALTVLSTTAGRHYQPSDLDFAQHLARRFALAVDNARLYDEAQSSRTMLDTLFASVPVGLAIFDTELRCVRANEAIAEMGGLTAADHLGRHASELFGVDGAELAEMFAAVLGSGEAVIDHELSGPIPTDPERTHHWLLSCTPVCPPDGPAIGVGVTAIDVTERRELLLRERARRRRAAFLARAGEILESSLDYETTLRNVARIAVPSIVDWCAVHIVDDSGEVRLVAVTHADAERERLAWELDARYPSDPAATRGVPNVIRTGRMEVESNIDERLLSSLELDPEHLRILLELGLRHSVCAPLRARGRTLGAITFVGAESHRELSSDDIELAQEIARRAGLSVDNARLYTERTRIAHTLQAELLPASLPTIPGTSVAVRYRAAGELNEVGGDFYDVFQQRDGDWAFVIGDVSGKGAEAAAVTALARHTVRTAALQPCSPGDLLRTLNEALVVQRAGSEFCTVCVARLRRGDASAALTLALGGHPPALVLRAADGRVEHHGISGTLMGVFADPRVEDAEVELMPGDTVLLYTDGVTEAGAPEHEIGEDGLAQVLAGLRGRAPEEVVDAVEQAAVEAQHGHPRDDMALVAFRVEP